MPVERNLCWPPAQHASRLRCSCNRSRPPGRRSATSPSWSRRCSTPSAPPGWGGAEAGVGGAGWCPWQEHTRTTHIIYSAHLPPPPPPLTLTPRTHCNAPPLAAASTRCRPPASRWAPTCAATSSSAPPPPCGNRSNPNHQFNLFISLLYISLALLSDYTCARGSLPPYYYKRLPSSPRQPLLLSGPWQHLSSELAARRRWQSLPLPCRCRRRRRRWSAAALSSLQRTRSQAQWVSRPWQYAGSKPCFTACTVMPPFAKGVMSHRLSAPPPLLRRPPPACAGGIAVTLVGHPFGECYLKLLVMMVRHSTSTTPQNGAA